MGVHVRRLRRNWLLVTAAAVIGVLVVVISMQIHALGEQLRQAESDSAVLADQVKRLGGVPLVSPSAGPPGERGKVGDKGDPGTPGRAPTTAEISAAVTMYLREHPPASGRAPTAGEVAAAVAVYLRDHPPARGLAGAKGDRGEPGATVTGPPGAKGEPGAEGKDGKDGADSTVAGPKGETGPRGETGPPPSSWTFDIGPVTYTCTPVETGSTSYMCKAT